VINIAIDPVRAAARAQERLTTAVQSHLDATARARGYDSALSCVTYLDSTVPAYKAEATAMKLWRDAVWVRCITLMGEVKAGQRPIPTESQLIALLPVIAW
jgi:hypothetical protein